MRTVHNASVAGAALVVLLLLTGCAGGGATGEADPEPTASPTPEGLTPVVSETGYRVTPDAGAPYEIDVTVWEPIDLSPEDGLAWVTTPSSDGSSGTASLGMDPVTECGYVEGYDVIVPFRAQVKALSDEPVNGSFTVAVDTSYGWGSERSLSDFNVTVQMVSRCGTDGEDGLAWVYDVEDLTADASFLPGTTDMLLLRGVKRLPDDVQQSVLNGISIMVNALELAPAGKLRLDYTNPEQTRLLDGNGCLAIQAPLALVAGGPSWVKPEQNECVSPVWINNDKS